MFSLDQIIHYDQMLCLIKEITFYCRTSPSPKRAKSPAECDLDVTSKTEETDDVFVKGESEPVVEAEVKVEDEKEEEEEHESPNATQTSNESAEVDEKIEPQSSEKYSVHQSGEQIESWMCKTCNCIFLDEVSSSTV